MPCPHRNQRDVIGGIAKDKFIQESRRRSRGQARDQADTRSTEVGLNCWKAGSVGPERGGIKLVPGIVDIAESPANLVGEIMVYTKQFFSPRGGKGRSRVPRVQPLCRFRNLGHERRRVDGVNRDYVPRKSQTS